VEARGLLGDDAPWMRSSRSKWDACMARRMYTDKNRSIQKSRYIKEVQYITHECDFSFRIGTRQSVSHHTALVQESEDCIYTNSQIQVTVFCFRLERKNTPCRSLIPQSMLKSVGPGCQHCPCKSTNFGVGSIHVASRFTLARFSAPASAPSTTTRHSTAA
jgi:hypothetical protein